MPIKVRCEECGAGMAVPDKAAGRAVKCKACGARVNVPAAASVEKKRRPPAEEGGSRSDDLFSGLDLRRAGDSRKKVCPSCAEPVSDDDIECPFCGVNIKTGVLSEKQKVKRARKGPDPDEFYGVIWKNAWKFTMGHKGFIVRTGITWGLSITMVILSAFVLTWYIPTREKELIDSNEGAEITNQGVLIQFKDATKQAGGGAKIKYDGVTYTPGSSLLKDGRVLLPTPRMAAIFSPPTYFWAFLFLVFVLSFGGWAWTLCGKIIGLTMAKEKKIKRFSADAYGNMTKGFTTIFWPIVLLYPIIWIPVAMYFGGAGTTASIVTFAAMFVTPYILFLPIAVVHMAQPYSYRSWLLNWVMMDFFNTLLPSLFVSAIFFVTVLVVPLGLAVGVAVGFEQVTDFYTKSIEVPALNAMAGYTDSNADDAWWFALVRVPFLFTVSLTCGMLFCMILAVPAVFMMRVFGLFGLYFRPDLELCVEQVPLSPAGFGPRFLAIQVDMIVAAAMCAACIMASQWLGGLVTTLYDNDAIGRLAFRLAAVISVLGSLGFYFANWESGAGRATLGKWAFGMLVLKEDNDPMPFKLALQRFGYSLVTIPTLSGTFTMCAFHPKHRAMHDLATKTKVVWRGDEDR